MKLNRKEKLLFVLPLLPLAAAGLMQLRFAPTLTLEHVRVTDGVTNPNPFEHRFVFVNISVKMHTWSVPYRVQSLKGPIPHSGFITGYIVDARGRKIEDYYKNIR